MSNFYMSGRKRHWRVGIWNDEVWRMIPGHEWSYWVSNCGRIASQRKVLSPEKKKNGYKRIRLSWKRVYVHKLVAEVFVSKGNNSEHLTRVRHINGDVSDNRRENLKWVTPREVSLTGKETEKTKAKIQNRLTEWSVTM